MISILYTIYQSVNPQQPQVNAPQQKINQINQELLESIERVQQLTVYTRTEDELFTYLFKNNHPEGSSNSRIEALQEYRERSAARGGAQILEVEQIILQLKEKKKLKNDSQSNKS